MGDDSRLYGVVVLVMELFPYYLEVGVVPLTADAIALVCDADRRDPVRDSVLLVRIR